MDEGEEVMPKVYVFPRRVSRNKRILLALVVTVLLVAVVIVALSIALTGSGKHDATINKVHFEPSGSPLDYFNTTNGLDITWYHAANSQLKLQQAITGDYMMIEADINLRWYGHPNQTDEPIMAHPPDVDSDLTLDVWIEKIIGTTDKGMKMDFKSDEVVRPSLEILSSKGSRVKLPVWLNADIVRGPLGGIPKDPQKFISAVNELYPVSTLSVGWTTGCCRMNYTQEQMEEMWNIVKGTTQPVTFPVRASLLRPSWEQLRWLMHRDLDRFSLTVWSSSGDDNWEGATAWDMLYCRNDLNKSKMYFDLVPGEKFDLFLNMSITAGSPLNYFDVPDMDGLHITWAHAVNSQADLTEALGNDIMFLEADVLLQGQGTENQTDIPIMAHPPDTESDITLEQWLDRVIHSGKQKGIKLDFKSIEALEPSLKLLVDRRPLLKQPIFINADILEGPGATKVPVNSTVFKRLVNEIFPWATLSVGWTTGWNNKPDDPVYDETMVSEMMSYVQDLNQPITFPIRASMIKSSWSALKPLLTVSRGHTLTIWSSTADVVDPADLAYIRKDSDVSKIYYDLPKTLMDNFVKLIT